MLLIVTGLSLNISEAFRTTHLPSKVIYSGKYWQQHLGRWSHEILLICMESLSLPGRRHVLKASKYTNSIQLRTTVITLGLEICWGMFDALDSNYYGD